MSIVNNYASTSGNYTVSQKGCDPNHGYNFVNS